MKRERQQALLAIINEKAVETQDELIEALKNRGFLVAQATVSRDIRELKLVKVRGEDGKQKYVREVPEAEEKSSSYRHMFSASIRSMESAENLIVIKTAPGMAMAVGAGIDALSIEGVLGCIAGDDTIFLAIANRKLAEQIMGEIRHAC